MSTFSLVWSGFMLYEGLVGSRSHRHFPIPRRWCFKLFLFCILGLGTHTVHSSASRLHGNNFDASSHGVLCDTVLPLHFLDISILVFRCGNHSLHSNGHTLYSFLMSDWV